MLTERPSIDTDVLDEIEVEDFLNSSLIVYNDDVNTFEWVIQCFRKYLGHTFEQAEQCAILIHMKGKCKVKSGTRTELEAYCTALCDSGLSAEIE